VGVSVCDTGDGTTVIIIPGSGGRLKSRKNKNPPRIITFAPRIVVPLEKKDLI
jgi:hypothetical protein